MQRILTEDKQRDSVVKILKRLGIRSYTLYPAQGSYNGFKEDSLVIELEGYEASLVRKAAREIAITNNQFGVLVQDIPSSSVMIGQEEHETETGRHSI